MGMITDLWKEGEIMRDIAVRMAIESLPDSFVDVLVILSNYSHDECRSMIMALQGVFPFLRKGYTKPLSLSETENPEDRFKELRSDYIEIRNILKKADEAAARAAYLYFDGLRYELKHLHPEYDYSGLHRTDEPENEGHQLMIFVTGNCNLQCSYCFSSDIERREISSEDLKRLFEWADREGCRIVTPCGGEPLLYSHIREFLDLVVRYGMKTYFASNCTIPLSEFSSAQLDAIDLITFHLTSSLWTNQEMMKIFCENIEITQRHNIRIIARANLISPNQNIEKWFEIIDRYGLERLNIAITIPSEAHDNKYTDPHHFKEYVPIVMRIVEMCKRRKVCLSFAKPIPPCVFPREYSRKLLQYENFQPSCNVSEDEGTKNVCISPDMIITPCLGVPEPKVRFHEGLTWQDLKEVMGGEIEKSTRKPLFPYCPECFLYSHGICQGACLSYKY